jgi:very-long-chain (3R)-3-hydroxyacyl-CoA dehydratase
MRKIYLLTYNTVQAVLWVHTAYLLAVHVSTHLSAPPSTRPNLGFLFTAVSSSALVAQRLSWLEVLHAAVGLAGGGVGAAFVQALGRSAVLLVLVQRVEAARTSVFALTLIAAATGSEMLRYVFYAASLIGICPHWLLVARYSAFLILYPVGISCEWMLYYLGLDEVDARQIYKLSMPNTYNFAFDYGIWNRGVLFSYAYFAPSMFLYMLRQRRKKLSNPTVSTARRLNQH